MHRIYANLTNEDSIPDDKIRPAILMQHGLVASSETFLLNGNDTSAFHFAMEGYDVWLGNKTQEQEHVHGEKKINKRHKMNMI